jgi:bifunctional non-homologous end joining protein LigD
VAEPDWLPASDEADVTVDGRAVRLTSLDKVLYPATGFRKRDLIAYYAQVAEVLLPHIADRPLTLGRWPSGVNARGFAQMECRGAPEWMSTRPLQLLSGELRNYCVVQDLASLVWVANLGTIELHPYMGGGEGGEEALLAIFDLDVHGGGDRLAATSGALRLRELLAERGVDGYAKTSGGSGIHVFVPLREPQDFGRVRAWCEEIAALLDAPGVTVDCLQNHPRRSLAAPYSLRAADVPVVSTPVGWDELEQAADRGEPLVFTADEVVERVGTLGDLFGPVSCQGLHGRDVGGEQGTSAKPTTEVPHEQRANER